MRKEHFGGIVTGFLLPTNFTSMGVLQNARNVIAERSQKCQEMEPAHIAERSPIFIRKEIDLQKKTDAIFSIRVNTYSLKPCHSKDLSLIKATVSLAL